MRRAVLALVLALSWAAAFPAPVRAQPRTVLPFAPGERLTYAISWTVVPAGTATLEVLPVEDFHGARALRFKAEARSSEFVDHFYKVRTTIESVADFDLTRTLFSHSDQNEGSYHKDATVDFDWDMARSVRRIKGKVTGELFIWPPRAYDPLSMLFAVRARPLITGLQIGDPVTDGKKLVQGRAEVGPIETVTTPLGTFRAFRIEPQVSQVGGVFQKSPGARLTIWITADDRRLPVKVQSEVIVGHFNLDLVKVEELGPGWR